MSIEATPAVPADLGFVTLKDFATFIKNTAGLSDPDTKAAMAEALGTATEAVEHVVGPLDNSEHTYLAIGDTSDVLVLADSRLDSLISVLDESGATLSGVRADLQAGILRGPFVRGQTYTVTVVTRPFGYAAKMAVKIIASHLYDVNRGQMASWPDGMMTPVDDPMAGKTGFAIPRRAADLLQPFLRGH